MLATLTGLGLSTAAGLNAYIPMLVVGFLARFTDLVRMPAEFGWLTNGWVLAGLTILLAAEVVLDKIPAVDTVNDAVQTLVRPAAGGAVFAATDAAERLDGQASSFMREHGWIGWVLGIAVALAVHAVKATARPLIDAGTFGVGAPVVSTAEDTASVGMSLAAILAPVIALLLILLTLGTGYRLLRRKRRAGRSAPT
ncbi:hypothetical protein BJF79_14755 [Actinomadura sp. CNU-125]|uniref:DUF4126 domain-containing protein n=1 Tax=Actinomadura sp. CNU-125 TaxID=1904961 RepID=UPI00095F6BC0|nr:DUF4126 domain-containing protein [Actinomadura sp. CNU-125]OLT22705.1 hypothetical protein BJF79_14755 [Actinomadura sp. CNU-125]